MYKPFLSTLSQSGIPAHEEMNINTPQKPVLKFQPILHSSISTSNSKQYTCNANDHPGNPVHLHDYVAFVVFQNTEMNMSERQKQKKE